MGYIGAQELERLAEAMNDSPYARYLKSLLREA
jgi:hypothetical protein